ncbi:hypothetical protein QFZ35_000207 [Arthrobacter ulcerisalmonis]|nr:hypothetical protein [Arthrobacter ulcerisalmonis]MDQ0661709.1 hypothetical protein [Arthrobacter ulcerisalmonis]
MTSASDNLVTLVDDMLQDAGLGQDAELRDALLALAALASLPAPAPTGELAALLAAGGPAEGAVAGGRTGERPGEQSGEVLTDDQPDDHHANDELARRRRRHRPAALGLVLVAGMGLGVGGVAASSTAPGSSAIEHLLADWAPWSHSTRDASAAGSGHRAPGVAADGKPAGIPSTAAPGGLPDAGERVFRSLQDPADLPSDAAAPLCPGPLEHDAGAGSGKCAAGTPWAASQDRGTGSSKDGAGPAAPEGTPGRPRCGRNRQWDNDA